MKYVILGASAAGVNAVRELRRLAPDGEITLISKDRDIYSRCILHHYLGGERTLERLNFAEPDFESLYHITWFRGKEAVGLNREKKLVELDDGGAVAYDKLLIATGSHTFIPPVPGLAEASNCIGFRNIDDAETLKEAAKTRKHIVVIGAGLIGLDCVSGFLELGIPVTLLHRSGWPLNRQLDQRAAQPYIDAFRARGVDQRYRAELSEVRLKDGEIYELVLKDGTVLPCDFLIVTTGVRPNVEFLKDSGIELSKSGLIYDETGRTSDPDIYGAGDVSGLRPIWPVAVKEGMIAASNMAGKPERMTDFFASKSTMSFLGVHSMSLGTVIPPDDSFRVDTCDKNGVYKKVISKDGVIVGALLQGDLSYGGVLQQMIARKLDVRKVKKPLFEIDYSDFFHEKSNLEFSYES